MKYHWESQDYKKTGVDDMVLLPQISDSAVVENLRKRFMDDCIYTYIGPVLVSVNPFKSLPFYGDKHIERYQGAAQYENPPHVYALTDEMYRDMLIEGESQCVIISGESGAGKTVAARYIMGYLTRVSGGGAKANHLKDVILESNPLLEAFGNAKTVRNDNSSRFGKYVEITFTIGGAPSGGQVTNFLLEKSRVVHQNGGERNFHVFYQLLRQKKQHLVEQLGLAAPDYFDFLRQSGCYDVGGIDDSAEFDETVKAMGVMGLDEHRQLEIFSAVAAVLHLGNVRFVEDGNYAKVLPDSMAYPAYLLGVSEDALRRKMESHSMESKWGSTTETTELLHNLEQATHARDALAKEVYSRLFNYVVGCVNGALAAAGAAGDAVRVGILDIYGFEVFESNGFEQFCINYVNEKLQQIFIDLTLKAEQEEYHSEGIKWTPIEYFNNKVVCELIEGRNPPGLMSVLDDVCLTMHGVNEGSDDSFLKKSRGAVGNHPHYNDSSKAFVIRHYAGNVEYDVNGFCVKNRDVLYADLIQVMQSSSSAFLRSLFPEDTSGKIKTRPTTAGSKIKEQANSLVVALMKCTPHYIRCIKPNETKKARDWDDKRVLHQVQYLGLKENIRVRRAGFAYRRPFDKFLRRYAILCQKTFPRWNGNVKEGVQLILRSADLEPGQCQLGRTKIFIKAPESVVIMEEARLRKYDVYARVIQNAFRNHFAKRRRLKLCEEAAELLAGRKERRENSLNRNYVGDYVGVEAKPELTEFIPRRCRIEFAQTVSKFDRRFNKWDRHLILFSRGMVILGEEKPTKGVDKGKTITAKKREVRFEDIVEVVLSPFQDNVVLLRVQGQFDSLLEITCKTEFLRALSKCYAHALNQNLPLRFTQEFEFQLKNSGWGGGGTRKVKFEKSNCSSVVFKPSRKMLVVLVGPGLDPNSRPTLRVAQRRRMTPGSQQGFRNNNGAPAPGPVRAAPVPPGSAPLPRPPMVSPSARNGSVDGHGQGQFSPPSLPPRNGSMDGRAHGQNSLPRLPTSSPGTRNESTGGQGRGQFSPPSLPPRNGSMDGGAHGQNSLPRLPMSSPGTRNGSTNGQGQGQVSPPSLPLRNGSMERLGLVQTSTPNKPVSKPPPPPNSLPPANQPILPYGARPGMNGTPVNNNQLNSGWRKLQNGTSGGNGRSGNDLGNSTPSPTPTANPFQMSVAELKATIGAKVPTKTAGQRGPSASLSPARIVDHNRNNRHPADVNDDDWDDDDGGVRGGGGKFFNLRPTPPPVGSSGPDRPSFLTKPKPNPGGGRPQPKPAVPNKPKNLSPPQAQKAEYAEALYPYEAKDEDELTLKIGDVIRIVKRDPSGWWEGVLGSKAGLFPGNFVKEV